MKGVPKIPYFQTSRYRVLTMVELAQPKPGEKCADLGAGDGRITIAFAKTGVTVCGYEIDANLRKLAEENIKKELLTSSHSGDERSEDSRIRNTTTTRTWTSQDDNYRKASISPNDFWSENLSQYNIICCYPMPTIMGRLERKLQEELLPGSRVVLNYFPFRHWKEKMMKDNVYLYIK